MELQEIDVLTADCRVTAMPAFCGDRLLEHVQSHGYWQSWIASAFKADSDRNTSKRELCALNVRCSTQRAAQFTHSFVCLLNNESVGDRAPVDLLDSMLRQHLMYCGSDSEQYLGYGLSGQNSVLSFQTSSKTSLSSTDASDRAEMGSKETTSANFRSAYGSNVDHVHTLLLEVIELSHAIRNSKLMTVSSQLLGRIISFDFGFREISERLFSQSLQLKERDILIDRMLSAVTRLRTSFDLSKKVSISSPAESHKSFNNVGDEFVPNHSDKNLAAIEYGTQGTSAAQQHKIISAATNDEDDSLATLLRDALRDSRLSLNLVPITVDNALACDIDFSSEATWKPDSEVTNCENCRRYFATGFYRKSHCRVCGHIFCKDCVSNTVPKEFTRVKRPEEGRTEAKEFFSKCCVLCFSKVSPALKHLHMVSTFMLSGLTLFEVWLLQFVSLSWRVPAAKMLNQMNRMLVLSPLVRTIQWSKVRSMLINNTHLFQGHAQVALVIHKALATEDPVKYYWSQVSAKGEYPASIVSDHQGPISLANYRQQPKSNNRLQVASPESQSDSAESSVAHLELERERGDTQWLAETSMVVRSLEQFLETTSSTNKTIFSHDCLGCPSSCGVMKRQFAGVDLLSSMADVANVPEDHSSAHSDGFTKKELDEKDSDSQLMGSHLKRLSLRLILGEAFEANETSQIAVAKSEISQLLPIYKSLVPILVDGLAASSIRWSVATSIFRLSTVSPALCLAFVLEVNSRTSALHSAHRSSLEEVLQECFAISCNIDDRQADPDVLKSMLSSRDFPLARTVTFLKIIDNITNIFSRDDIISAVLDGCDREGLLSLEGGKAEYLQIDSEQFGPAMADFDATGASSAEETSANTSMNSFMSLQGFLSRKGTVRAPQTDIPVKPFLYPFDASVTIVAIRVSGIKLKTNAATRPMVIPLIDNKGDTHLILYKREPMRQDLIATHINGFLLHLLEEKASRQTLHIPRYSVICMSPHSGLVQIVPSSTTLQNICNDFAYLNKGSPNVGGGLAEVAVADVEAEAPTSGERQPSSEQIVETFAQPIGESTVNRRSHEFTSDGLPSPRGLEPTLMTEMPLESDALLEEVNLNIQEEAIQQAISPTTEGFRMTFQEDSSACSRAPDVLVDTSALQAPIRGPLPPTLFPSATKPKPLDGSPPKPSSGVISQPIDQSPHNSKKHGPLLSYYLYHICNINKVPEKVAAARFLLSAQYFLVTNYWLAISDRHRDNVMVTDDGYVFHIDFGFMLGASPSHEVLAANILNPKSAKFQFIRFDSDFRECVVYFVNILYTFSESKKSVSEINAASWINSDSDTDEVKGETSNAIDQQTAVDFFISQTADLFLELRKHSYAVLILLQHLIRHTREHRHITAAPAASGFYGLSMASAMSLAGTVVQKVTARAIGSLAPIIPMSIPLALRPKLLTQPTEAVQDIATDEEQIENLDVVLERRSELLLDHTMEGKADSEARGKFIAKMKECLVSRSGTIRDWAHGAKAVYKKSIEDIRFTL